RSFTVERVRYSAAGHFRSAHRHEFSLGSVGAARKTLVVGFAFTVPRSNGYPIVGPKRTVVVGYKGLVFADPQTKAVMRIEVECVDVPFDAEFRSVKLELDYRPAHLGGREWILPAHYLQSFSEELALITKGRLLSRLRCPTLYSPPATVWNPQALTAAGIRTNRNGQIRSVEYGSVFLRPPAPTAEIS